MADQAARRALSAASCRRISPPSEARVCSASTAIALPLGMASSPSGLGRYTRRLVIVRGEKETAPPGVLEMVEQAVGEPAREFEVFAVPACLQELEDRIDQVGVVVEIRIESCLAVAAGRKQSTVTPVVLQQVAQCALGRIDPVGAVQQAPGSSHALDHQGIPAGQDLLVAPGPNPLVTFGQQLDACAQQQFAYLAAPRVR